LTKLIAYTTACCYRTSRDYYFGVWKLRDRRAHGLRSHGCIKLCGIFLEQPAQLRLSSLSCRFNGRLCLRYL